MNLTYFSWFLLLGSVLAGFVRNDKSRRPLQVTAALQAAASILMVWTGLRGMAGVTWEALLIPVSGVHGVFFGLDRLSGTFLFILGIIGFSASWFSARYLEHSLARWNFHWIPILQGCFLFSLSGLFLSANVVTFLLFWELMAFSSFGLVVTESKFETERRTGFLYLVMSHVAALFLAIGLLFPCAVSGSPSFASWAATLAGFSLKTRWFVYACLLIGFGTKAGMVPFHVWLPRAHPQAPSHVSSLMSGVMIKTGIYGLFRFLVVPGLPVEEGWGWLILSLGMVSALLGVLYALIQHHLKALLAYHSVENIGIILLGMGMGLIFRSHGREAEAVMAFSASLFHTLNHALFKGLLFLGAGAVQVRTGTGHLDELGGVARAMPLVSVMFFIGAASISGLPPTNGFASEWMVYRSLIAGFQLPSMVCKVAMPILAALLALTGALAAGCFVKAFGTVFLGKPRSEWGSRGDDGARHLARSMAVLAGFCLLFGVVPEIVTGPMGQVFSPHPPENLASVPLSWVTGLDDPVLPLMVLSCLVAGVVFGWFLLGGIWSRKAVARVGTWNCGTPLTPRMSYTASAFAEPFMVFFSFLFAPHRDLRDHGTSAPLTPEKMTYKVRTRKFIEEILYKPVLGFFLVSSRRMQHIQAGSLHGYLFGMFLVVLILLVFGR